MLRRLWLVHICDSGHLCRYFDIYPMYSVAFVVWWIITQWHLPLVDIWGGCKTWFGAMPPKTFCLALITTFLSLSISKCFPWRCPFKLGNMCKWQEIGWVWQFLSKPLCNQCLASKRERNVLFNDALNTFYLRLYGVRHMVRDRSDSEKGNPLLPHMLLLSINSKGSFICAIPQTG